jgi:hypothetical protein
VHLDPKGVAMMLERYSEGIAFTVLNACYSEVLVDVLLTRGIRCAVGMAREVDDAAAILFSQVFYKAVFDGASVDDAFHDAKSTVYSRYRGEAEVPVLRCAAGTDPAEIFLVS